MSTKIYNGYIFDKNYSLRELDKLLTEVRKTMQAKAKELFFKQVLDEWLYIYDCYTYFGEEIALKRMNKYGKEYKTLNWNTIFNDIFFYIENKILKAKNSMVRDLDYDYEYYIHILPIEDKLLFLYYGEKNEFEEILRRLPFVKEYHYQNQTDKPDYISDKEWEQRKLDWDEAIIDYVPSNHGFTVDLVNTNNLGYIYLETLEKVNPAIKTKEERAKTIAYDIEFPCEEFKLSTMLSQEYKDFLKKNQEIILQQLSDFKNWKEIWNFVSVE